MISQHGVTLAQLDLFTPQVPPERLHPNFVHVAQGSPPEDRDVLNEWAKGFVDRDGKFVIEFQTTFNSSFWELYLFAVFKKLDYRVDLSFPRPDFMVERNGLRFAIEATVASNAAGKPAEWEGSPQEFMTLKDRGPLVVEATVRLCNSLTAKYRKYESDYRNLPELRGTPFVLAIAPFEQPFGRVQNTQAIFQALYAKTPIPYEEAGSAPDGRTIVTGGYLVDRSTVTKSSGAEIPLGMFTDRRMPEISAVMFSSVATWGKVRALSKDPNPSVFFETLRVNNFGPFPFHTITPRAEYREHLLDGLCVYHNPDALFPLPLEAFRGPMVTQVTWPPGNAEPYVETSPGVLLQRTVMTVRR